MAKQTVSVGVANEGSLNLEIDTVKEWKPTDVSKFKDVIYFKADGKFYSMKREDYIKIFN